MIFVRNWLAIGTPRDDTPPHDIGAVLMLTHGYQSHVPSLSLRVPGTRPAPAHLIQRGMAFIHDQRNEGKRILITCDDGLNRAPAFALAAIKEKSGHTLNLMEIYRSLLRKQPRIQVHPALWQSLCDYFTDEPPADVLWPRVQMLAQHTTDPTQPTRLYDVTV